MITATRLGLRSLLGLRLLLLLHRLQQPYERADMIENEKTLVVVEDLIVMCKALLVSDRVERFQCRNRHLKNTFGHLGLDDAVHPEMLNVRSEQAIQGQVTICR